MILTTIVQTKKGYVNDKARPRSNRNSRVVHGTIKKSVSIQFSEAKNQIKSSEKEDILKMWRNICLMYASGS